MKNWVGKNISAYILGLICGGCIINTFQSKKIIAYCREKDKYLEMFLLMNSWVYKLRRRKVSDYLKENSFHSVAIYGMGYIGENLYEDLLCDNIEIKYLIDQNVRQIKGRFTQTMDENIEPVDVIIVTALYDYDKIKLKLQRRSNACILSLAEIIYTM
ncbi:hypothetical protein C817_03116 [Dorea sp. 5-2]|jgi:hypothetical protein|uniref:hypothetical protein n=1 Tax=Sporofaciens sp. JLR.KK001 TaxID=3112621 RepID=UPI00033E7FA8|nr:hypothetical protein C817_03116 [Dorea sp. 5-2]